MPLRNIIIRDISDEERNAVEVAKRETGYKQASKAVMKVVISYSRIVRCACFYKKENKRLKKENLELKEFVSRIVQIHEEMIEKLKL